MNFDAGTSATITCCQNFRFLFCPASCCAKTPALFAASEYNTSNGFRIFYLLRVFTEKIWFRKEFNQKRIYTKQSSTLAIINVWCINCCV